MSAVDAHSPFVRDGQDYVRVSTNVKKQEGSRATGTKLNLSGAIALAQSLLEASGNLKAIASESESVMVRQSWRIWPWFFRGIVGGA